MRILVVEDDPRVGAILEHGLRAEDFDIVRAVDGEEGLARALDGGFDIILLDHNLPRKNGLEVALAIRARGPRPPIMMLTARDEPDDIRRSREAGVDEVLGKPFRLGELIERIHALVPGPNGGAPAA